MCRILMICFQISASLFNDIISFSELFNALAIHVEEL